MSAGQGDPSTGPDAAGSADPGATRSSETAHMGAPASETAASTGPQTQEERDKRRRGRSLAIAGVLVGLVVIFYVITLIQLGTGPGPEAVDQGVS